MYKTTPSYLLMATLLTFGTVYGGTATNATARPIGNAVPHVQHPSEVSLVAPQCLQDEVVSKRISVTLTAAALAELLEGYNYGAVWERDGHLATVIVSSRADDPGAACPDVSGGNPAVPLAQVSQAPEPLVSYEPMPAEMPDY